MLFDNLNFQNSTTSVAQLVLVFYKDAVKSGFGIDMDDIVSGSKILMIDQKDTASPSAARHNDQHYCVSVDGKA